MVWNAGRLVANIRLLGYGLRMCACGVIGAREGVVVMLALSFEYRRCFPLFFSAMDNVFKGCALVVECF